MSYEKVKKAKNVLIGTKQTKKAILQGTVEEVIIAMMQINISSIQLLNYVRIEGSPLVLWTP